MNVSSLIAPQELLLEIWRRDFLEFAYAMYHEVHGKRLKPNWHHKAIAHALAGITTGGRLCINLPPRNLKSFLCSVAWPAWLLGRDPSCKILCASYGSELSEDLARQCRRIMKTPLYQRIFPRTRIADRNTVTDFHTTAGGYRRSTSVLGPATGLGGDITIIDDPVKAGEVNLATAIARAETWFRDSFVSRGDDKQAGIQVLIMQRLHEKDLAGTVIELGWPLLCLPAINNEDRRIPISPKRYHHWREGELLHPEHEPQAVLDDLLRSQGPRTFSAQYLQNPLPAVGSLILRAWIERYDKDPRSLGGGQIFQSWDAASSPSETADYSACVTVRKIGGRYYVVDVFRGRLPFDLLRAKALELNRTWRPDAILIENTSSGTGLAQDLQALHTHFLPPIRLINPGIQSKYERVDSQTGLIAAGGLYLPTSATWLADFEHELFGFPNAAHDDMVDALAQLLGWAKRFRPPPPNAGPELVEISDFDPYEDYNKPCPEWIEQNSTLTDDPWGA